MSILATQFWLNVTQQPDAPALLPELNPDYPHEDKWWSWRDLGAAVDAVARRLLSHEIKPHEHVASHLPNSLEWIALDLACQTLALVHVAIDANEPRQRAAAQAEFAEARLLVDRIADDAPKRVVYRLRFQMLCALDSKVATGYSYLPRLHLATAHRQSKFSEATLSVYRQRCGRISDVSPAQMLFTSGSVAQPKGVLLSHRNLATNAAAKLDAAPQTSSDLRLNILPFSHAYARTCELSTWILTGGRLALCCDWNSLLQIAPLLEPTLINMVPSLARRLCRLFEQGGRPLGSRIRLLQVGGAALDNDTFAALRSHGLPPLQGYGLTEASPVVCSNRAGEQRAGTIGPPVHGVEVKIDASGELCTRGPNLFLGYWRDPAATAAQFRDGWLATGDLADRDEVGNFRIVGRISSQIVLSSGYKLSPEPIERLLLEDRRIEQCVLLGEGRRSPVALVYVAPSSSNECEISPSIVRRWIEERLVSLPRYMCPRRVLLLDKPLSQSSGHLTHKNTPRRRSLEQSYAAQLNRLVP